MGNVSRTGVQLLNEAGDWFCHFAGVMAVQACALVLVLLAVDLLIRRKIRAVVRYWLWMLVVVKLLLPIDLKTPLSVAYWLPPLETSERVANESAVSHERAKLAETSVGGLAEVPTASVELPHLAATASMPASHSPVDRVAVVAPAEPIRWSAVAFMAWLVVVAGQVAVVMRRMIAVRRLIGAAVEPSAELQSELAECFTAVERSKQRVRLGITDRLGSPAIAGFWQATILLPSHLLKKLDRQQRRLVFTHELAHWRRFDLQIHCLQTALQIFYFYNPAVWIANAVIRRLREEAVDETVLAAMRSQADRYGATLLDIAAGMLKPAESMLRLIGVVESRKALAGRIKRLVSRPIPRTAKVGFLGIGAILLTGLVLLPMAGRGQIASAESNTDGEQKKTTATSGIVRDEKGNPVPNAMVYVYSAGVREGTSPYCPTCYADCGKRAFTDAEGKFEIESLDPTLVFRLLVAARGYRPQSIAKVDPLKGKALAAKLKSRPLPDDPKCIVQGTVINPLGNPAVGAIVEPFGCKKGERRWWGHMPGVDELAITDKEGKFVLVCVEPVEGLDLQVECAGAARKKFSLVTSGRDDHPLGLQVGSTVSGRVVQNGAPVEGVEIGIAQVNRSDNFVGPYSVATDSSGRFTIANLPPGDELFVYGIMDSLKSRGSIPAVKITPPTDKPLDLGDIRIVPAYSIRGRIVLTDGKPVPPHTRVLIGRNEAWDTQKIEANADGEFEAIGVPAEYMSIHAMIRGYYLSPKNKSFEPLNATSIEGVVDADVKDLIVLFEPGEMKRPNARDQREFQVMAEKRKRLKSQQIAGVTGDLEAPPQEPVRHSTPALHKPLPKIEIPPETKLESPDDATGEKKVISGVVVDADGKGIPSAKVWLPCNFVPPYIPSFKWLTVTATCDVQGKFTLEVPEKWLPSDVTRRHDIVWAYAPGYALGTQRTYQQLFNGKTDECRIELPAVSNVRFVVLSPVWEPVAGAKVEPEHFKTGQGYNIIPDEVLPLLSATTDEKGRVALPGVVREHMLNVAVESQEFGRQLYRVDTKDIDNKKEELILRGVGRIEGRVVADQVELTRGMLIQVETEGEISNTEPQSPKGVAMLSVDKQGRFVVPAIAYGRVGLEARCDERLPVRPRLPERNQIVFLAGETAEIEIPLEMTVQVRGVLRAKDSQKPIPGAKISVRYGVGRQGESAVTNKDGVYEARVLPGNVSTQVIYFGGSDYVQLGEAWNQKIPVPETPEVFDLPPIEASPTTIIRGTVVGDDGKPLVGVDISGLVGNRCYGSGKSDKDGKFLLSGIPQGVELDGFHVWQNYVPKRCIVDSTDPLVVRVPNENENSPQ